MDPDISRWCIEFLVRQENVSDNLLSKILSALPVETERPSLRKELVIREVAGFISEGLITESILDSLEKMVELDSRGGIKVAASVKRAYCAAAVHCTTLYLEGSSFKQGKYLEAVDRIWRGRIKGLDSRQSELVTDELKGFMDEIEAALWDAHARRRLLARPTNALHLVEVCLNEVRTIMGPPFLELVAQTQMYSGGSDLVGVEEPSYHANEGVDAKNDEQGKPRDGKKHQMEASGTGSGGNAYGVDSDTNVMVLKREETENVGDVGWSDGENLKESEDKYGQSPPGICVELRAAKRKEIHVEMELPKCKYPTSRRQTSRPMVVNDIDDEELPIELPPRSKYDTLPSPEVNKVAESLRASSLELQRVVRDPLPDALQMAEAAQSKIARNQSSYNKGSLPASTIDEPVQTQVHQDLDTANTHNSVESETVKNVGSHNLKKSVHSHSSGQDVQNNVPRPSLMEKNDTARTHEWDDSVDGSPQRICLDDPKRVGISPLNRIRKGNWTRAEEEALLQGVREYGVGNWKRIWNAKHDVLAIRSTGDLKDKWRNMQKHHRGYV